MKIRVLAAALTLTIFACSEKTSVPASEVQVEFITTIEDILKSPPKDFLQLPSDEQDLIKNLLSTDRPNEATHIGFTRGLHLGEPYLSISIFEQGVRNGRIMTSGPVFGYKRVGSIWVLKSQSID